jgi:hypothetical protein
MNDRFELVICVADCICVTRWPAREEYSVTNFLTTHPGASRFSEKQRVWNGVHSVS